MKNILLFLLILLLLTLCQAKKQFYIVGETQNGIFQQYNRDQCYYTNKDGMKSIKATYDDTTGAVYFLKYTSENCSNEYVSEVSYQFALKTQRKKSVGFKGVEDDSRCSHKEFTDGDYYAPTCFKTLTGRSSLYTQNTENNKWVVLKHYYDDSCSSFKNEERLFECDKCIDTKWCTCGSSSVVIILVIFLITLFF